MATKPSLLLDQTLVSVLERHRSQQLGLELDTGDAGEIRRSCGTLRAGILALEREQRADKEAGHLSFERLRKNEEVLLRLQTGFDKLLQLVGDQEGPEFLNLQPLRLGRDDADSSGRYSDRHSDSHRDEGRAGDRQELLPSSPRKMVRFRDDPVDVPEGASNHEHLQLQQQMISEQDESLDRLSRSIGRQHELSIQIGDELEQHVELLDDVDGMVDHSRDRLDKAKHSLRRFSRRARDHGSFLVIVTLIVVLVILIAILK